ncbi:MAG TPA: aldehyde dehydrogenase family protein, partial [Polyangiaceae bacterium]|nr:aldehyde dehydrogenase family protein [Polyangiaceae bacterium]
MTACPDQETIEVCEPATRKPLGVVLTASGDEIASTARRAREAQAAWAKCSSSARAQHLLSWRQLLIQEGRQLAEELARENGKPYHEALIHEVIALTGFLEFIAKTAPALLEPHSSTPKWFKHRIHHLQFRPRGVVAVLVPFNFPLLIAGADAAAALAMGCAVVLKPSPACPLIVERLVRLAHRAGIPEAVLSLVHGGPEVGQQLVRANVDEVVFTGSVENGRQIAQICATKLTPYTLELGGNCPLLVLDDADVERTARAIVLGALTNSGQSCFAVGRVLVARQIAPVLQEQLANAIGLLRQGDPLSAESDLGAVTTAAQLERCRRHVEQAISLGARAFHGSHCTSLDGNFFPPTLLMDARPD